MPRQEISLTCEVTYTAEFTHKIALSRPIAFADITTPSLVSHCSMMASKP